MDDLISRKVAIKAIEDLQDCYNGFSDTYDKACIIGVLEELPSAQQERKEGRWKPYPIAEGCLQCSECGVLRMSKSSNYCPNCGAKMGGDAK